MSRLALFSALLLTGCAAAAPLLMTFAEYREVVHGVPYVIELAAGRGRLLYYGAEHLPDAAHPQNADIQRRWNEFRPTLALNEGGTPPVLSTWQEGVDRYGEAALVAWLGRRDNVPVRSLEPARGELVAALARRFTAEQIKVAFTLRAVTSWRSARAAEADLDQTIAARLQSEGRVAGLEGAPRDLGELQASVGRLLPQLADWRQVPGGWFDPALPMPRRWTNDLAAGESQVRDEQIVRVLLEAVRAGGRVFAVIGASHVVMQERALRARRR